MYTLRIVLKTECVWFGLWLRGLGEGSRKFEGEGMGGGGKMCLISFVSQQTKVTFDL